MQLVSLCWQPRSTMKKTISTKLVRWDWSDFPREALGISSEQFMPLWNAMNGLRLDWSRSDTVGGCSWYPWASKQDWLNGGRKRDRSLYKMPGIYIYIHIWVAVSKCFIFIPIWENDPIWLMTNNFQMGWNHQLELHRKNELACKVLVRV